ncbi:MAG: hypothetical protein WDN46_23165 [Methylocella sp.]
MKNPTKSDDDKGRSHTVRLSADISAKVEEIAKARLWSFSKTLAVLVERAIEAKVLK